MDDRGEGQGDQEGEDDEGSHAVGKGLFRLSLHTLSDGVRTKFRVVSLNQNKSKIYHSQNLPKVSRILDNLLTFIKLFLLVGFTSPCEDENGLLLSGHEADPFK